MKHIVLAGDSIFDNRPYVRHDQPAVIDQLTKKVGVNNRATLLAVDGDVTADVANQLKSLPKDATEIFISVGGNDGLQAMSIFYEEADRVGEALISIHQLRIGFEERYRQMVETAIETGLPITLCTIYYPRYATKSLDRVVGQIGSESRGDGIQQMVMSALAVYNDVIFRVAIENGLNIIDLRTLCNADEDFANPIEPSMIGGDKITDVIVNSVLGGDKEERILIY
jgi:hypothetical protein